MIQDWKIISQALYDLLFTYGFSAKKTSGYGVIRNQIDDVTFCIGGGTEKIDGDKGNFKSVIEKIKSIINGVN